MRALLREGLESWQRASKDSEDEAVPLDVMCQEERSIAASASEDFGVAAYTFEDEQVITHKSIDEHEVRSYVALPRAFPVSMKRMIPICFRKWYTCFKSVFDVVKLSAFVKKTVISAL